MNHALIKHFKLSESDLAQLQGTLQPHQTLIEVLLEKNMIDQAAYLAWAKEHYSLPVLKIEFLNKTNNAETLLDRYKNVFPKNVIPFHEMDGVMYVMCLEPTPFEAPQTIQYVLAPLDVIQKYSPKNETSITHEEPVEIQTVAENTNPLFKDLEASKGPSPLDSFSFDNISLGDSKPQTEESFSSPPEGGEEIKLEDKSDVPAGLDFPPTPTGDDSFVSDKPVSSVDLNSFKFEGLMPVVDTPAQASAPTATPAPTQTAPPAVPVAPTPVAPPKASVASADSLIAKHPPKNKPAPQPATAPAPVHTPVAAPAVTPAPQPTAVAAPTQPSRPTPYDGVLQALKKHFDQTMVLLFTNGHLEPRAWDTSWEKVAHTQNIVDTTAPGIFRIVNETQHPYHGHVVPNSANDSFFHNWNKGQYPEHVTIYPIIHDKKIYGMILGSTTKAGAKKYQLHHIQEIANDAFAVLSSNKAAA